MVASGLAMDEIELEKVADHFDCDHDGFIDLNEIAEDTPSPCDSQ